MPHALIIGGGIGGLTAGIALRQAGWTATVYERAPELREVGAGITLWSNAAKVLRKLGVAAAVERLAHPIGQSEIRTWRGKLLAQSDMRSISARVGAPSVCIHRAELQSALVAAFGREGLQLGWECAHFVQDSVGVTATSSDGRDARGDILIGADGIKSVIRNQILGDEPLRYAGYTAWRGVGNIDRPDVPQGVTMVAIGRGSQAGMVPIGPGRIYWFATANVPEGQSDPPGGHRAALLKRFADWYSAIPACVEATPESAIVRNDIYDRPPVKRWGEGRVTLLGDSAHPTTPNLGQGACQAIESAAVLAKRLTGTVDIASALRDYESSRFERTAIITKQSRAIGKAFAYQSWLKCAMRNLLVRLFQGSIQRDVEKLLSVEV